MHPHISTKTENSTKERAINPAFISASQNTKHASNADRHYEITMIMIIINPAFISASRNMKHASNADRHLSN